MSGSAESVGRRAAYSVLPQMGKNQKAGVEALPKKHGGERPGKARTALAAPGPQRKRARAALC
eukprot:365680-Alexandrium_andersonii.AAC.1